MRVAIVTLVAVAHVAWAGDGSPVSVSVGFFVERTVGNANGWFCDDPSLVEATLETRGDTNVWIVKGVKPGFTQCRVGTDIARASYVMDVTVNVGSPRKPAPVVTPKPAVAPAPAPAVSKPPPTKPKAPSKRKAKRPRKPRK